MGRRQRVTEPPKSDFKYVSDEHGLAHVKCEENEPYHVIKPSVWPPQIASNNPNGEMSAQCVLCNCWCIVTTSNDPDRTGINVIEPERPARKAAVPA